MSVSFQHRCDLYAPAPGEGSLGSPSETRTLVKEDVKCTFAKRRERAINNAGASLSQMMQEFLVIPPGETAEHGWFVTNIHTRKGDVIEAGPFLIETVTPELHLGGGVSHQMLILKRSYS